MLGREHPFKGHINSFLALRTVLQGFFVVRLTVSPFPPPMLQWGLRASGCMPVPGRKA